MTREQLKQNDVIYFENVEFGLRNYRNYIMKMRQSEAIIVFLGLCQGCGWEDTFVDFYYYTLDAETQGKLHKYLNKEERDYLEQHRIMGEALAKKNPPEVVFTLDKVLLFIVTKLNEEGALFSTLYFSGIKGVKSTWWGNYNQEYIVFTD